MVPEDEAPRDEKGFERPEQLVEAKATAKGLVSLAGR